MRAAHTSGRRYLSTIGILLCLLAALFAIEAKLAWYSPTGSPAAPISTLKLQAADKVRHLNTIQASSFADTKPQPAFFLLALASLMVAVWFVRAGVEPQPATPFSHFSSNLFFRPPPAS